MSLAIAVDATCWHNRRGYGRHARALLRALIGLDSANRYTLFLDSTGPAEPTPAGCEVRLVQASVPAVQAASAEGSRSIADMWRMSRALSSSEFDVVLFPTIYSFVPVFSRARKLVMMHDVIAETFPQLTVPRPAARLFWNIKVALGRMQADALITVSDYSKQEILRRFGGDASHVHVVGEAADPVFRKLEQVCPGPNLKKLGLDGARQTVVYLGGFSPHKNLEALVNAFARCRSASAKSTGDKNRSLAPLDSDPVLVMVGDTSGDAFHTYYGTIAALVEELGLNDRVVFTGFLPDEDLVVLLNFATVLVLPSLMEGFGLPAVEAAACGCPVIATKASPLPGLLGEAGVFVEPTEDEIVRALDLVLSSPEMRAQMEEHASQAAGQLTWEAAARQMMAVIHKT